MCLYQRAFEYVASPVSTRTMIARAAFWASRHLRTLVFVCYAVQVLGHASYVSLSPNGASVPDGEGGFVDGIGHVDHGGGGALNSYGTAFGAALLTWSATLCIADSDGDGYSNGAELGDPCCVWSAGGGDPLWLTDISHPGEATSIPSPHVDCNATVCPHGVDPCTGLPASPSPNASPPPSASPRGNTAPPSLPDTEVAFIVAGVAAVSLLLGATISSLRFRRRPARTTIGDDSTEALLVSSPSV